jgi:hypothetical protein
MYRQDITDSRSNDLHRDHKSQHTTQRPRPNSVAPASFIRISLSNRANEHFLADLGAEPHVSMGPAYVLTS